MAQTTRTAHRIARHGRVRKKIAGTAQRPRLVVFRSLTHIYAQLIDDVSRTTLAAASDKDVRPATDSPSPTEPGKTARATSVGTQLAERAKAAGIEAVVFDRGGYRYHGRVKALAEAARKGGLQF